jgi:ATP-dependent Lon protease
VGGIREKILAAHRSGLKTVILPRRNIKDLVDVPKRAREELKLVPVEHMDQVLEIALVEKPIHIRKSRMKRETEENKSHSDAAVNPIGEIPPIQPAA